MPFPKQKQRKSVLGVRTGVGLGRGGTERKGGRETATGMLNNQNKIGCGTEKDQRETIKLCKL